MVRPFPHRYAILYGSLRRRQSAYETLGLADSFRFVRPVRFPGRMLDLGDYPGVISRPDGDVRGELYLLRRPSILAVLDAFELHRPGDRRPYDACANRGSLFVREIRRIGGVAAYIYLYNGETRRRRPVRIVRSGLWRARRGLGNGHLG